MSEYELRIEVTERADANTESERVPQCFLPRVTCVTKQIQRNANATEIKLNAPVCFKNIPSTTHDIL